MKRFFCGSIYLIILAGFICSLPLQAIEVERFEHINSDVGLSQNSVLSMYCDHKGYLWFGTMNGLNRFDGHEFKICKAVPGEQNRLTNNRIGRVWEDKRNFIWIQTYDGYYHYFNPENEKFYTFPKYYQSQEEKNSEITFFYQDSGSEIWLGSSNSGVYYLTYDETSHGYEIKHFLSRGVSSISNNNISFVLRDGKDNYWIGTSQGLNMLEKANLADEYPEFHHYFVNQKFTEACIYQEKVWFGTMQNGLVIYDPQKRVFENLPEPLSFIDTQEITVLENYKNELLVIGTQQSGLILYNSVKQTYEQYGLNGARVLSVYIDKYDELWVKTEEFGITRIVPERDISKFYKLTPNEIENLVDEERQYLFEDRNKNLWIGLHGGGLATYVRNEDRFVFYRNDPNDPKTISSNFVHCIMEDNSGLLWVGTGQFNGGINKIIMSDPSFKQIVPKKQIQDMSENVIRSIFEDSNGYIWMGTKSGKIYIYDAELNLKTHLENLPLVSKELSGYIIYTIFQDSEGYIWLGSKGGGVAVSSQPLQKINKQYHTIKFHLYQNKPENNNSLSNNNVYTIIQDRYGSIWIGTYGGGINLVEKRTPTELVCKRIQRENSTISSNEIRQIYSDSQNRLWVASVFGLNLLDQNTIDEDTVKFRTFYYDPENDSSISYSDIIHIFEDDNQQLWFSTFGGGINKLTSYSGQNVRFEHFNQHDGLVNDAVFGILQDNEGDIWLSTENGISRFDYENRVFENFDKNNGMLSNNFSENTCCKTRNNYLLFGSTHGTLLIKPDKISKSHYIPDVVFTNFYIFNKEVDIHADDAPIRKNIEYVSEITLQYYQSSFGIEYAALSYFDPLKNKYEYRLEGLDPVSSGWNEVGNQNRATYNNLSPGEYTFRVRASNWDGTLNPAPRTIKIRIKPPWWKTNVAKVIYLIVLMVLFEMARRIFSRYNLMRNDLKVERRVNEIKLQFFTNISHEIRTPLTLLLGPLSDIKNHKNLPSSVIRSLDIMERNGKRLLRLVSQLLDFRKIQKNKMKLKVRQIELVGFVNEVYQNFDQIARQKKIKYTFKSDFSFIYVWADTDKFDTVLFNVLSNAFKFTSSNKEIGVHITSGEGNFIDIRIEDQGKGLEKEQLNLLFQRFTPLSVDDVNFNGTGIGLSLSYEIMKLHSGQILVESEKGKGSVFTVRLLPGSSHFEPDDFIYDELKKDVKHIEPIEMEMMSDTPDDEGDQKQKSKVLIVEDNEEIVNYLKSLLSQSFEIKSAENGKEGIGILKDFHPDMIITDVMMPEMDGIEMTRQIKKDIETSHIPVIMLTAKSAIEDQIIGIDSGAEAYILKPFNSEYLSVVIKNLLVQRQIIISKYWDKKNVEPDKIKITKRDDEFMSNTVKIIEDNYSDPDFNVEKLVQLSTVSRTVMYNKLKGLTGLSPVEFLRQSRLKKAAAILQGSDRTVSETAYLTGFNDLKYFSKCFKQIYGVSPKDYRKG